jgi:hypothetical protein
MAENLFEQLKKKYQSVLNFMNSHNVQLQNLNLQDNELLIRGTAPSQDVKNKIESAGSFMGMPISTCGSSKPTKIS